MSSASTIQRVAAVAGVVFGLATVVAGGRVLAGADPGYEVFRPLLIYNTMMGAAVWLVLLLVLVWLGARSRARRLST